MDILDVQTLTSHGSRQIRLIYLRSIFKMLLFNWILVDEQTTNISYRQSCTLCSMPEALIYASNEPKSYSWYDLGDCRDSHNKHALRVYYGWIFLRLFIYVMVVSATVRYGTSMSHISLPQTSVSVDSWVVKEKSKNYHNWTSSASHDVCAAPIFTYIMSGCGLIYKKWMCG